MNKYIILLIYNEYNKINSKYQNFHIWKKKAQ